MQPRGLGAGPLLGLLLCGAGAAQQPSASARAQVEADWARHEQVTWGRELGDPAALDALLERGQALIANLTQRGAALAARRARARLEAVADLRDAPAGAGSDELYRQARWALRELLFAHPALDFDELLFVRRPWPRWAHQCSHHVGEAQEPGADLCVLSGLGPDGEVRSILGQGLPPGGIGRPDLSFDGRRVVFPWAAPRVPASAYGSGQHGVRGGACHMYDLYEVGVDGQGLRRLTDDPAEDTEPCYLPDGRIAFTSSRVGRWVQCGDWALVFCLYSMAPDGSDVRKTTEAKEGEWYPSLLDDGRLLYMRWEYVMKPYNTVQYLWSVYPDGRRARLAYGDHYNFSQGPLTFIEPRPIPGTSKVVATGAAHHNAGVGPICVLDLARNRAGEQGLRRLTPEVGYPEADSSNVRSAAGWYSSPYPLDEDHFLVCYSFEQDHASRAGYGLYLMDSAGNRELVYRDPRLSCYSPIPLKPRPVPRALPVARAAGAQPPTGTVLVHDVTRGLEGVAAGEARYLRVLETLPKLAHTWPQRCDVGVGSGWDLRSVLGTVELAADGSAYFEVPADRSLFFEVLDRDHLEIRRMRSFMSVAPGEVASCIGCHEPEGQAPPNWRPAALAGGPVAITPPPWGVGTIGFEELVQPLLDRECVACHHARAGQPGCVDLSGGRRVRAPVWSDPDEGPQHNVSRSFLALLEHVSYARVGAYDGEELPAGAYAFGSHESPLMRLLAHDHHGLRLAPEDWRLLAAWIDCNAPYLGSWDAIDISPSPLDPPPYPAERVAERSAALAAAAPAGARLVAYLDCGFATRAGRPGGVELRQRNGAPYVWAGADAAATACDASVAFEAGVLEFELVGLDPARRYRLGLTWWDYDSQQRTQSVELVRAGTIEPLLGPTPLPSWRARRAGPETRLFEVAGGADLVLRVRAEGGANAVAGELWLVEQPGPAGDGR